MGKTALFISAFLLGMGYVAIEMALQSGWHPFAILSLTGLIIGVTLLILSLEKNGGTTQRWLNKALLLVCY